MIKSSILKSVVLAILSICVIGCKNYDKGLVDATVIQTPNITNENEACGYVLQLSDSSIIKPDYLPSAYQFDKYPVKIKYSYTDYMDTCEYAQKIFNVVKIEKIKRNLD